MPMPWAISAATSKLLDVILGPQTPCAVCSAPIASFGGPELCGQCLSAIPMAVGLRCSKCSAPIRLRQDRTGGAGVAAAPASGRGADTPLCRGCETGRHYFAAASSVALYEGAARTMVGDLKYRARLELARPMAWLMAEECAKRGLAMKCDVAVPVPMHPAKQARRGYNQAALLSDALGRILWMKSLPEALSKSEEQESQTMHDRAGRRTNAMRVYGCASPASVARRCVLLVDDVLTSGATADGCARALLRAGASEVYVVTFAISVADARDWMEPKARGAGDMRDARRARSSGVILEK